jgi:putative Mg2+ transporter-C (MgtC) family protein
MNVSRKDHILNASATRFHYALPLRRYVFNRTDFGVHMAVLYGVPYGMGEIVLRILLAGVMGLLFGLERQYNKKPVGFGAFMFVCIGAAALTVMAVTVTDMPTPIMSAVITGIGFLGAGAILKPTTSKVQGITTAASLWVFAAIGVIVGIGMYFEAVLVYLLVGLIVLIDHFFERNGFGSYSKTVTLTLSDLKRLPEIEKILPKHKAMMYSFDNTKKEYSMSFLLSGNKREVNMTLNELIRQPQVTNVKVE